MREPVVTGHISQSPVGATGPVIAAPAMRRSPSPLPGLLWSGHRLPRVPLRLRLAPPWATTRRPCRGSGSTTTRGGACPLVLHRQSLCPKRIYSGRGSRGNVPFCCICVAPQGRSSVAQGDQREPWVKVTPFPRAPAGAIVTIDSDKHQRRPRAVPWACCQWRARVHVQGPSMGATLKRSLGVRERQRQRRPRAVPWACCQWRARVPAAEEGAWLPLPCVDSRRPCRGSSCLDIAYPGFRFAFGLLHPGLLPVAPAGALEPRKSDHNHTGASQARNSSPRQC